MTATVTTPATDVLVSTAWVADHLNDPHIRLVESDEDILLYEIGHIPGAVKVDWTADLQDPLVRDFISPAQFAQLMSRNGIANDTTVVFYGDKNNWWAAYAYWFFKLNGHPNLKIMDGGRAKWEAEGRAYTRDAASYPATQYTPGTYHPEYRALRDEVLSFIDYTNGGHGEKPQGPLVDVRSPQEFSGELMHMPAYPQEGALRGGHIPGAKNIPWAKAVAEDGTFKPIPELRALYEGQGITPDKDVIAYCRIGERSSHTWFVLHELLGYKNVRNYDGSWTEWGNVVRVPIEK
ncbi:MAG: sulfurtransferase [Chloroflexota bacterium]|nr:sulfurtransferase [Chloroflexota bacterium]